jgi:hypothetical protein
MQKILDPTGTRTRITEVNKDRGGEKAGELVKEK